MSSGNINQKGQNRPQQQPQQPPRQNPPPPEPAETESAVSEPRSERKATLAILGAGPIGVEAALVASRLKIDFMWFEKAQVGDHLNKWGHLQTHAPAKTMVSEIGLEEIRKNNLEEFLVNLEEPATGKAFRDGYLSLLLETPLLSGKLEAGTEAVAAGRDNRLREDPRGPRDPLGPFRLFVRGPNNQEQHVLADAVIDCTGVLATPRPMGKGGLPAPGENACKDRIAYCVEDIPGADRKKFADRTVLVVGAGVSAATAVTQLAELAKEHEATWVVWLSRRNSTLPVRRIPQDPLKGRDSIAAAANHIACRPEGNLEFHSGAWIDRLEPQGNDKPVKVFATIGAKEQMWEVDRILSLCGYQPSRLLNRELRMPWETSLDLPPTGLDSREQELNPGPATEEPGWYVLGSKSYGRASGFEVRAGYRQVRQAMAEILRVRLPEITKRLAA
ncbi:MAG: FAD-dependent oxidoreductase [Gemmataceae bacterium]|nr:FAD-dependent oxidoreductase [Gemmataceae bacterium]